MKSNDCGPRWLVLVSCFLCLGINEAAFIGAERCKLCHRSIYVSWKATAHARATESLNLERETPTCLPCHSTGPSALPGVQCESCHGAGGDYWPPEIMIDPAKVREAGLITANQGICRKCHGNGLPGHAEAFEMPGGNALAAATH